jgi:two-component system phosphate regulon response regulator OmpR
VSGPRPASDDALILVVDDDLRLRELLSRYLAEQGFRVSTAQDAAEARDRMRFLEPDLLVLDVMMPGENGVDLTEALRRERAADGRGDLPVLLLTARGAPEDRIAGFEAGADDYLGKPFDPRELVLRIRAMLRRAAAPPQAAGPAGPSAAPTGPLALGALEFDMARSELRGPRGPVRLTGGEAALLAVLAEHPGQILTREALTERLGMDESAERAIDVQVTRLRRKIEPDPREPRFLHTVRGRGYVLKPGR